MDKKPQGMSMEGKVMVGVGIAAAAAAVAGAVFLYGTEAGKKKRKQITSWMFRMKADVLEKLEEMKDVTEETYHAVVDSVAEKYNSLKTIDAGEIAELVASLKAHWKTIEKEIHGKVKKAGKAKKA